MTMIDRKNAELARRNVIRIDAQSNPEGVDLAIRTECCKVWNEFCAQETRRLAAKPTRYAQIMPGGFVGTR